MAGATYAATIRVPCTMPVRVALVSLPSLVALRLHAPNGIVTQTSNGAAHSRIAASIARPLTFM